MLSNILNKKLDQFLKLMPGVNMISLSDVAQQMEIPIDEVENLYQILKDKDYIKTVAKPDYIELTKSGRNFKLDSKFLNYEDESINEQLFNVYLGHSKTHFDRILVNIRTGALTKLVDAFHIGALSIFINGIKYSLENLNKIKVFRSDRPEEYWDYLTMQANKGEVLHNEFDEVILHDYDLGHFGPDVTSLFIIDDYGSMQTKTNNKAMEYNLDIFLSHSHKDKDAAKMIADLVSKAFNLENKQIRCTSAAGYKFRGGTKTMETLRSEVETSKLLLVLITENSVNSDYVLFELGARWGLQMPYIPLFYSEGGSNLLPGPLSNIIGLSMSDSSDMHQLIDDISEVISLKPQPANVYNNQIKDIVSFTELK